MTLLTYHPLPAHCSTHVLACSSRPTRGWLGRSTGLSGKPRRCRDLRQEGGARRAGVSRVMVWIHEVMLLQIVRSDLHPLRLIPKDLFKVKSRINGCKRSIHGVSPLLTYFELHYVVAALLYCDTREGLISAGRREERLFTRLFYIYSI